MGNILIGHMICMWKTKTAVMGKISLRGNKKKIYTRTHGMLFREN